MIGRWLAAAAAVIFGAACGGGGGGGGGGGSQGVRVLHSGIDSPPYVMSLAQGGEPLQVARFAESSRYFGVPRGQQSLNVASIKGSTVFEFEIPAERPARQSVLLYGSRSSGGARAAVLDDTAAEMPSGMCALRLVNGVEDSWELSASAGGEAVARGVRLGQASGYVLLAGGVYDAAVNHGGSVLYRGVIDLKAGRAYSLWAAGEAGYFAVVRLTED